MPDNDFRNVATTCLCDKWDYTIRRNLPLYDRKDDVRSDFGRDYTRILHSLAYRRLKHKTQVFFNTKNDHICTRMEHVNHVESVSYIIARYLGLNDELTKAIATGHDLGHPPFGHQGEVVLNGISQKYLNEAFWHERNGLYCVDSIELLEDPKRRLFNLDLTYAVRDGIVSHCGEIDENAIKPRDKAIDLYTIEKAGEIQPYTWEACVVKISDKIAYIGRDIEDAYRLNFIGWSELRQLTKLAREFGFETLNTTLFIHEIIIDLCKNSSPQLGLTISSKNIELMNRLKEYNYKYIYKNERLDPFKKYVELVITSIFKVLYDLYDTEDIILRLEDARFNYPELINEFIQWLKKYANIEERNIEPRYGIIYGKLESAQEYAKAIIDFISCMTDQYAINMFNELTEY